MLRRLSVFSGGWTLEAAEDITGFDGVDVFFALEGLVNKSLVEVGRSDPEAARYRFLESIRQYARDRLFEVGEGEALRERHAEYFVTHALEVVPHMYAADMMDWIPRLRTELDNLRALVAWSVESRPVYALKLAGMIYHQQAFWMRPDEAREWCEAAVQAARPLFEAGDPEIPHADFINALISLGITEGFRGDQARAIPIGEEALELARQYAEQQLLARVLPLTAMVAIFNRRIELLSRAEEAIRISRENGFEVELFFALVILGGIYLFGGDVGKGEALIEEGLAMSMVSGNPRNLARVLDVRAAVLMFKGDLAGAAEMHRQAAEKFEEIGDVVRANMSRSNVGHNFRRAGDMEEAEAWYRQTIPAYLDYGHPPAVAHQLECFAFIAIERGQFERAARLLGAAGEIRRRVNSPSTDPVEIGELEKALNALNEALGEAARDRLMAEGARLEMDEAVGFALGERYSPE